ncbi:MAG TPA: hypothetical protein VNW99_10780 [Cytophagaceae bacterium]|jgi:hypothetical protein|nr:hypothetical protein [Cytophagaceae bacterium]
MLELVTKLFGGTLLSGAKGIIDDVVKSKEDREALYTKFQDMLAKHGEEIINMEVQDRDSARKREVETTKAGSRNFTQNVMAYLGVVGFFGIVGYILSRGLGNMTAEESFIIGNLTGMAGAIAKDIYGYYFGSSKGEHENQQHMMGNFDWQKFKNSDEFKKLTSLGKEKQN